MYVYWQFTISIITSHMLFHGIRSSDVKPFTQFRFIRVIPATIEHVVNLNTLEEIYGENNVILLRSPGPPGVPIDIVLKTSSFESFLEDLKSVGISFTVENVEDELNEKLRKRRDVSDDEYDHTRYHFYDEMIEWLKTLEQRHKDIASLLSIGKTFEGRDIYVMKITSKTGIEEEKSGIWIEGGVHAREKITPATMIFMIEQILDQYGKDDSWTSLVNNTVLYLVPVVNIDGYEYAMIPMENVTSVAEFFYNTSAVADEIWTKLRWRKTRSIHENTPCIGVDPNRNWNYKWQATPTILINNETYCSLTDAGPKPFSEIEIRNVANFLLNHTNIDGYISIHSYGQMIIFPWCWTSEKVGHYDELRLIAEKATKAITSVFGTEYRYGSVAEIISAGNLGGCSCDWTYQVAGITYSFGMELRDRGAHGFFLPEDQIEPTGIETLAGIKEIVKHIASIDDQNDAASVGLSHWIACLCFIVFYSSRRL